MTNSPSKTSGNMSAAAGAIKENVGHALGNKSMEADGAAKRAKGNAEVETAKAQGYAAGTADKAMGSVKKAAGNVVGNEQMRVEGEAEKTKGDAKQKVNK